MGDGGKVSDGFFAIVNPAAGGGRCGELAGAALHRLRRAGLTIDEARTNAPGDARRLAREAYARGVRRFVAVGGDGTAYEIVNGLLPEALSAAAVDRPRLGFLPLGTGNSFLRDFAESGAEHAANALVQGRARACDVVRLVHDSGELYFINLLSMGFVADVATLANRRFKRLGAAGYAVAVVLQTAALAARRVQMRLDDGALEEHDAVFVSFCNSRYTGGTMMMAPFAETADGQLDVVVAHAMGRFALLTAFPRIFSGTHVRLPKINCVHARKIELEVPTPIDLMIDGEVETHRPLALELLPSAIEVSA